MRRQSPGLLVRRTDVCLRATPLFPCLDDNERSELDREGAPKEATVRSSQKALLSESEINSFSPGVAGWKQNIFTCKGCKRLYTIPWEQTKVRTAVFPTLFVRLIVYAFNLS